MKNPGIIFKLPDNRICIAYNKQPLLEERGKIILNLVDEDYNLLKHENGKPKVLIKSVDLYNEEAHTWKLMGYVD